jgi:glycosyltransferase involved in cell wall biosynthesis
MREGATRVLHVVEATGAGTLRVLENIITASAASTIAMGMVYSRERCDPRFGEVLERAEAVGWETYELPMVRRIDPLADLSCVRRLRRIVSSFEPHVLHCHSSKAGGIGRLAVRLPGTRPYVIYSPHALSAHLGPHYAMVERCLAPLTDLFIADSESEKQEIVAHRLAPEDRVKTVYLAVDTTHFAPHDRAAARRELGLDGRPLVVGLGRMAEQKNPLGFVRIVARAKRAIPRLRAIWVGDGSLRRTVEEHLRAESLQDDVTIAGWQDDVRPYIAAANVVLSSATYESFGYIVAESLAMLRPVVASAVTGTIDILRDLEVGLYTPGDEAAAARALQQLLEDPAMAVTVASTGRQLVRERFSVKGMWDGLLDAYRDGRRGIVSGRLSPAVG